MSTWTTSLGLVAIWNRKTSPVKPSMLMSSPSISTLPLTVTVPAWLSMSISGADDADLAHLPAHQGGVRTGVRPRRSGCQSRLHTAQVFRRGFLAYQHQAAYWGWPASRASAFCGEQTILPVAAPGPAPGCPWSTAFPPLLRFGFEIEQRLQQLAQVAAPG